MRAPFSQPTSKRRVSFISKASITGAALLPVTRWSGVLGSISYRTEPGSLFHMAGSYWKEVQNYVPDALFSASGFLWKSCARILEFSTSFSWFSGLGRFMNNWNAALAQNAEKGSILIWILIIGICAWLGVAAFRSGERRTRLWRLVSSILFLSVFLCMGMASSLKGEAPGSPWWVMDSLNSAINKLSGTQFPILGYKNPMASAAGPSCANYVSAMTNQYKKSVKDPNSILEAVNEIWEETALKNWVEAQYGKIGSLGGDSSMAYCHVLDALANASPSEQALLTDKELNVSISSQTAQWIFSMGNWISMWNGAVDPSSQAVEPTEADEEARMAVFWNTCGSAAGARPGFRELEASLMAGPAIRGSGGSWLRPGTKTFLWQGGASDWSTSPPLNQKTADTEEVAKVCRAVLEGSPPLFAADNNGFEKQGGYVIAKPGSNLDNMAEIGWMNDIPNAPQTWITAQQTPVKSASGKMETVNWQNPEGAFKNTKEEVGYINGNPGISWSLAFSSLASAIVNFLVWGFLALNLILSKLALAILCMFLSLAFLLAAIPVGDLPRHILKRWASACLPVAVTGLLTSLFGSVCVFITQAVMDQASSAPALVVGASPMLSLWAVNLFCQKVLKIGKPLSIKNTLEAVKNESAAGELQRAIQKGIRLASHPVENFKASLKAPFRPLGEMHYKRESSIPQDLWAQREGTEQRSGDFQNPIKKTSAPEEERQATGQEQGKSFKSPSWQSVATPGFKGTQPSKQKEEMPMTQQTPAPPKEAKPGSRPSAPVGTEKTKEKEQKSKGNEEPKMRPMSERPVEKEEARGEEEALKDLEEGKKGLSDYRRKSL